MMDILVAAEPQQLYLPGLTRNAELDDQRRFRTSTSHTPAESRRALFITSLAGPDTSPNITPAS